MRRGKDQQLQIRVTAAEKAAIQRAAAKAGMDMSAWVLAKLLLPPQQTFHRLGQTLAAADSEGRRFALAELNDFLSNLGRSELDAAVAEPPPPLAPYVHNYVAAMVETAAHHLQLAPPAWTTAVAPLDEPVFGTPLPGLRLHLLLSAPPPFRRRNIFIDASIGDRK